MVSKRGKFLELARDREIMQGVGNVPFSEEEQSVEIFRTTNRKGQAVEMREVPAAVVNKIMNKRQPSAESIDTGLVVKPKKHRYGSLA